MWIIFQFSKPIIIWNTTIFALGAHGIRKASTIDNKPKPETSISIRPNAMYKNYEVCLLHDWATTIPFFDTILTMFIKRPKNSRIYMNPTVTNDLNPTRLDTITISVRKIIRYCGKSSGIFIEVRDLIKDCPQWINAWLVLKKLSFGWYEVSRVFWRKNQ